MDQKAVLGMRGTEYVHPELMEGRARRIDKVWRVLVITCCCLAAAGSLLVMLGWLENKALLLSVLPGYATEKWNTAVSILLLAVSILLKRLPGAGRVQNALADGLATLALLLATANLIEYATGGVAGHR